jgi:hypothetical protein
MGSHVCWEKPRFVCCFVAASRYGPRAVEFAYLRGLINQICPTSKKGTSEICKGLF